MSLNRSRHLLPVILSALFVLFASAAVWAAAPTVTITAPTPTLYTNAASVDVTFIYTSDTTSSAKVTLTNKTTGQLSPAAWTASGLSAGTHQVTATVAISSLTDYDGTYDIAVEVTDGNGLKGTATVAGAVVRDIADPTADALSATPVPNSYVGTAKPEISLSGISDDLSGIDTVTMKLDGVLTSSAFAGGKVSYTPAANLADGTKNVRVDILDKAGNGVTYLWGFIVDTKPPTIEVTAQPAALSSVKKPTIEAALDDIATPAADIASTITLDGTLVKSVTGNTISWTAASDLADGTHTAVITARDLMGNSSQQTITFAIDTAKPAVTSLTPGDGVFLATGSIQPIATIGSAYGVEDMTVTFTLKDALDATVDTATAPSSSEITYNADTKTYYWDPAVSLADGKYKLSVVATNVPSGVTGDVKINNITVDTTAPVVSLFYLQDGQSQVSIGGYDYVAKKKPVVEFTVTEANLSGINVTLDGAAVTATTTSTTSPYAYSYTPGADLADGWHVMTVVARDKAGNANVLASLRFAVDTTAPAVVADSQKPIMARAGGATEVSVKFVDALSGLSTASFVIDAQPALTGAIDGAGKASVTIDTSGFNMDVPHSVTVKVKDALGNEATTSWTFNLDNTAPTIGSAKLDPEKLPATTPKVTTSAKPTVSFVVTDDKAGIDPASVAVEVDAVAYDAAFDATTGTASYTFPKSLAQDHTYVIRGLAADKAGNAVVTSLFSFTVNTSNLVFSDVQPTTAWISADSQLISARITAPGAQTFDTANVKVTVNGTAVPSTDLVFSASGTVSATEVQYTKTGIADKATVAYHIEAAGNWPAAPTVALDGSFTRDALAPVITVGAEKWFNTLKPTLSIPVSDFSGIASWSVSLVPLGEGGGPAIDVDKKLEGGAIVVTPKADLVDGDMYTLSVSATDLAGNSSSATQDFGVDATAPTPIVTMTGAPVVTKAVPFKVSYSMVLAIGDTANKLELVDGDGNAIATINDPSTSGYVYAPVGTVDGKYQLKASVTDRAGNSGTGMSTGALYVDTAAPVVEIVPADTANVKSADVISIQMSDLVGFREGDMWASVKFDGVQVSGLELTLNDYTEGPAGTLSSAKLTFPPGALEPGEHTVVVTIGDVLGHNTVKTSTFIYDPNPPVVGDIHPLDGTEASITRGSTIWIPVSGGGTVELKIDGTKIERSAYSIFGGRLVYALPSLTFGQHTIEITATNGVTTVKKTSTYTLKQYREGFGFGRLWFE